MSAFAANLLGAAIVALLLAAAALAIVAAAARSLFALCLNIALIGALCAAALLALGVSDAALAAMLVGAGVAPFALMGVLLLSGVTVKQRKRARPWPTIAAAIVTGALVAVALPDLGPSTAPAPQTTMAPWLALLVFVVALGAIGVIGFGERGVFERPRRSGAN
ncbi:MAG: hypothetical protein ABUL73_00360 [Alphaproteobacteria bacterium]